MITENRLKELIEQGAIIYRVYADVSVYETKLSKVIHDVDNAHLWENLNNRFIPKRVGYPLNQLFETKEEAEEYLEFGNIVREERLELPSWEEFLKMSLWDDKNNVEFKTNKGNTIQIFKTKQSEIIVMRDTETVFNKPLTKENYNEARRLCKKLFLGEKYERNMIEFNKKDEIEKYYDQKINA